MRVNNLVPFVIAATLRYLWTPLLPFATKKRTTLNIRAANLPINYLRRATTRVSVRVNSINRRARVLINLVAEAAGYHQGNEKHTE